MSDFLEILKSRMADSQRRLQEATQKLQAAQAEHQAAAQEAASWQNAVTVETRRETLAQVAAQAKSGQPVAALPQAGPTPIQAPVPPSEDINKAELIRQLLRDNPGGLTPAEVWRKLNSQIHRRSYVYAVLGRLKDREQVTVKRGKYYFRVAPREEGKELVIQ